MRIDCGDLEVLIKGPICALHAQTCIQHEQWFADGFHNGLRISTRGLQLRIALLEFLVQDKQLFVSGLDLFFRGFQFFIEAL